MRMGGTSLLLVPIPAEEASLEARAAVLSAEEMERCAGFSAPKRRRDWLAGRIAAKRLLAGRLALLGVDVPLTRILIGNDSDGAPTWKLGRRVKADVPAWPISISHSGMFAGAAVLDGPGRIGMDLEKVEPRNPAWLEVAFHPDERPAAARSHAAATRMWTRKEAVLKFLGLGLRVDLWDVRCAAGDAVRLAGRALQRHMELGAPEIRFEQAEREGHVITTAASPVPVPAAGATPE